MNSYDKAYELAKAIAKDPVILEFEEVKKKLEQDENLSKVFKEFKDKRAILQLNTIQEGKADEELEQDLKKMYQELLANPLAIEYFEKEVKVNILISDIQKIIYQDIQDVLK